MAKITTVHDDIRILEGWVNKLIGNLEKRVTSAFATQQDMIDNV